MKSHTIRNLLFAALLAVSVAGCSLATLGHFLGNVSADDCATSAAQQAFVGNLPQLAFMTNAQAVALMNQFCSGAFGTTAAPTPALGMSGIFATATPAAVPTPAPATTSH